jgi:hypothetical protein
LPNAQTVEVPLRLRLPAGSLLDHIQTLVEGSNSNPLEAINISESLYLSNGRKIPVRFTMNLVKSI